MADSTWQHLRLDRDGWIATLTLSRPPVNALSGDLVRELAAATKVLAGDEGVSVVVLRSDQRHFCAGADLKERETLAADRVSAVVAAIRSCFDGIARLPQPTIVAVNGSALGGGAELALACDLRVMADDVRFGFPEVSLGIIPGGGGTQRLPRIIGPTRAKELIFSARILDGAGCLELGLAERVVPRAELAAAARSYAEELARNAPLALRAAKRAITQGLERPMAEALRQEGEAYDSLIPTRDREEGIRAFMEKRPPGWEGK